MKIKISNKVKNFQSIFSKEKEVKEILLEIGEYQLSITEHQYGMDLSEPFVDVSNKDVIHSMSLKTFMDKIFTNRD